MAQTPPLQTPPPPPQPSVEQPAAPVEKSPVILENTGKPIRVPVECGGDEIQSFGLTCTIDDPCPVFLELVEVESLGARLLAVGNLHTTSITLSSVLLASDDGAKTWREPHERLRAAGLEHIQFVDFETGWVSGQVLQAMPRDSFFLITNDGGKTWRQKPVFGESRVGSVEQFFFESRNNGLMLIDRTQTSETGARYELYESATGGETWSLRQVSGKPLPMKRTKTVNPDWRLRADAATKAYRIEKRDGTRWQAVSSFLVAAGECRPKEPQAEPEPPPEPAVVEPAKPAFPTVPGTKKAPSLKKP
jgi:hypothetical protein